MFTITQDCGGLQEAIDELNYWVKENPTRILVQQTIVNTEEHCTLIITYKTK